MLWLRHDEEIIPDFRLIKCPTNCLAILFTFFYRLSKTKEKKAPFQSNQLATALINQILLFPAAIFVAQFMNVIKKEKKENEKKGSALRKSTEMPILCFSISRSATFKYTVTYFDGQPPCVFLFISLAVLRRTAQAILIVQL